MGLVTTNAQLKATYEEELREPKPTPEKQAFPINPGEKGRYVNFVNDSKKTPSPIEVLHNEETRLTSRFPLAEYYAQGKGSGELGLRRSSRFFTEPFVIKNVGDRWGFGGVEQFASNNTIADIIDIGSSFINSIGGAVLGRTPNEYVGNAIGSLERTGKFLLTTRGAGFLTKQAVLMRSNPQQVRTDVKYGVFDDPNSLANGDPQSAGNLLKLLENPRLYNPLSLGSLPGVTKHAMIDILAKDPTLVANDYLSTIAGRISTGALKAAESVAGKVIEFGKDAINLIGGAIAGAARKFPKIGIKTPSINLKMPDIAVPTVDMSGIKEKAKQISDNVKKVAEVFSDSQGLISKQAGVSIDADAFSSVGVDRVNLIPYGTRDKAKYNGKDEETLDFIPFRFEDKNGKLMVFRAILSGITDTFSPDYSEERYVGRPDNVYVYQGTQREITFTFDVYPKSDKELVRLWEKLNYLAGLTYPEFVSHDGGGAGMVSPFCKLTIGDMYKDSPGYISGLTYTVMDESTWETTFLKLPKYVQVSCNFIYIGDRLPTMTQKHFELPFVAEEKYSDLASSFLSDTLSKFSQTKFEIGEAKDDLKKLNQFINN